ASIAPSRFASTGLEQLLGHERGEQHVAELHHRRDTRLRRKDFLRLRAHESPFKALSVGAESHEIRAAQAAHIDGAIHGPRDLSTMTEENPLRVCACRT